MEDLEERIIKTLRECGPCSFEDLIARVGGVDLWEVRRVIASLVRRGVIEKVPSQERRKLLYRLSSGS